MLALEQRTPLTDGPLVHVQIDRKRHGPRSAMPEDRYPPELRARRAAERTANASMINPACQFSERVRRGREGEELQDQPPRAGPRCSIPAKRHKRSPNVVEGRPSNR